MTQFLEGDDEVEEIRPDFEETKNALLQAIVGKSYEIEELPEAASSNVYYSAPLGADELEELPVFDEEDRDILMHRDAHFSENFEIMKEYYEKEGKGAILDIDVDRIEELELIERRLGRNLSPLLLQGADAEKIAFSRMLYQKLQDLYESKDEEKDLLLHIADLILSENEPEVDAQIIAKQGQKIVPLLLQLLDTPQFLDPLFPGYGLAPIAATYALGILKAEVAIPTLFQLIGSQDFELESAALKSLYEIGEKAKQFCLTVLQGLPITGDNEKAALALLSFKDDEEVCRTVLEQLKNPQFLKREPLVSYLLLIGENLPKNMRDEYRQIAQQETLPIPVKKEMEVIIQSWKK